MLHRLREQRPVTIAIGCALLQFAITLVIILAGKAALPAEQFGQVKLVAFASTLIVPALLAYALGLWRELGLQRFRLSPFFLASLLACVPYLLLGLRVPADTGIAQSFSIQAVNAVAEELLFRGVIFALLIRLPLGRVLIINGLLFGSMHLLHGIMDGDWAAAGYQAMMTVIGGMIFTAVRAETNSLWPPILLHMLLNLSVIFSSGEAARAAGTLDYAIIASRAWQLLLVGWLLWGSRGRRVERAAELPA